MEQQVNTEAVIAAVREVGDMAMVRQRAMVAGSADAPRSWMKAPGDIVTEVDIAVDTRLRAILSAVDPGAGWLSEETTDDRSRLGALRIWCVDPIDGTRDYVRGRPGWCVSVALIDRGLPVLGVLYAPAHDGLWLARKGAGATVNGRAVRVGTRQLITGARIPSAGLSRADRDLVAVAQPNSIALRLAMVADDHADLIATLRWGHEWDIAAAALIVAEAGGVVTDALGDPLAFNTPRAMAFGLAAANPALHAPLVARIGSEARRIAAGPVDKSGSRS